VKDISWIVEVQIFLVFSDFSDCLDCGEVEVLIGSL
jgi:hypothetical protein